MATTMDSTTTTTRKTRVGAPVSRKAIYWGIAIVLAIILVFAFAQRVDRADTVSPAVNSTAPAYDSTAPTYDSTVDRSATDTDLSGSTVNDSRTDTDTGTMNRTTNDPAVSPDTGTTPSTPGY